jgi:hypothetical protein
MLASLFSKVTASLGKTYVYSGLLPAGTLLMLIALQSSPSQFVKPVQTLLADGNTWKSVALLGFVWLAVGFLFYVSRGLVLSLFQHIPGGWFGRKLLFLQSARRERLNRERIEIEWSATAVAWLTALDLDTKKMGDLPFWISRPEVEEALNSSKRGRETLTAIDLTAGDMMNLGASACDTIIAGVFALYGVVQRTQPNIAERAAIEIKGWREAKRSKRAQEVLRAVMQDLTRKKTRALLRSGRLGRRPRLKPKDETVESAAMEEYARSFGDDAYVFPTDLGNKLAVMNYYCEDSYGIDTTAMWDRLWWVLPKEAKNELSDARLALESVINFALALLFAGIIVSVSLLASCWDSQSSPNVCNAFGAVLPVCILMMSYLTYRGAGLAMDVLSVKTTTLVDMYRLLMLKQMGFVPKTVGEELGYYRKLAGFFGRAAELDPTWTIARAESLSEKQEKREEDPEKGGKKIDEVEKGAKAEGKDDSADTSVSEDETNDARNGGQWV